MYSFGGLTELPDPLPSLHGREGSPFLGCVPLNDKVNSESVVGVKPPDSGVVIEFQVDELLTPGYQCAALLDHMLNSSFMGKVPTLTHFPLGPGFEA